jgi:hypothetical protein
MTRKELDWEKKISCVHGSYCETDKSVTRIRLVKTESPRARAKVNRKVCRIAIAL